MPQLSNFQREVIVLFREEHPTWGLQKCRKILPEFVGAITTDQFRGVAAAFKQGGSPVAKVRKHGSGTSWTHGTTCLLMSFVEQLRTGWIASVAVLQLMDSILSGICNLLLANSLLITQ